MEATESHIDRVDRPATQQFQDRVAGLLEPKAAFDVGTSGAGHVDEAVAAEEVGRVEEVDVQRLALDPLTAVEQFRNAANCPSTTTPQASSIARQALSWYATGQIPHTREVMSGGSV